MYIYNKNRSLPQARSPKKARKKTQTFLLVECNRQSKAHFSQQNKLHSYMYCVFFFVVYLDFYVLLILYYAHKKYLI